MSDKENELLERDAVALVEKCGQIVKRSSDTNLVSNSANNSVNNLLVNNSSTNSLGFNIRNCNGVQIGNVFNISGCIPGLNRGSGNNLIDSSSTYNAPLQPICSASQIQEEAKVYRKTRTISELMKSTEQLNEQYLDIFAENFGNRYLQLPILLQIDDLFVQRMHVDYFHSGQSREVRLIFF